MNLNQQTVRVIAEEVSERTVNKVFLSFGIDASNPSDVLQFQKDLAHLRHWREATSEIQQKGLMTIVTVLITGSLGWLAYAIFGHHL